MMLLKVILQLLIYLVQNLRNLEANTGLEHLDVSDNRITTISDISHLKSLQVCNCWLSYAVSRAGVVIRLLVGGLIVLSAINYISKRIAQSSL